MVVENHQINEPFLKDALGTFHKGFELKTEKPVIVHCIDDTLANDPEFIEIYNSYLSNASQLKIPNFAKATSGGNKSEILYTIYPNSGLIPLNKVLSQNNILSIFDAPGLLEKISMSIRALHIEGFIHGSLSPKCIFVDDKLERFEIFNAGSEQLIRHLLKKYPGNLQNILPYLPPEILNPNTVLQRQSDIYSLGVLFYTFLVGNTPWPDAGLETLLTSRDSIVPPSLHRLEVPDFLDTFILDAVETNPEKRSANLSLFLNSLAEVKSNILAAFTPTSALIYGPSDESSPFISEDSHEPAKEDRDYEEIKTDTTSGLKGEMKNLIETNDYKDQLLNHENDFFSPGSESVTTQNDSSADLTEKKEKPAEPEKQLSHFENGISESKPIAPGHHPPKQKIENQTSGLESLSGKKVIPEIYTDVSALDQEQELEFKTHQTSFPGIQINELDDRLSFKNYRDRQGAKEAQPVQDKTKINKVPGTTVTSQPPQQSGKLHVTPNQQQRNYYPGEFGDFNEITETATEEYVTEQFNVSKSRSRKRFVQNILKKVGIPLVSILSIYLLVLFMIDLGLSDGLKNIKENIQKAQNKQKRNQANISPSQRVRNRTKQNNLQSNANPVFTQNQNFEQLTQSINNNLRDMSGLRKNPLANLKSRRNATTMNKGSTYQTQQNSTPLPASTPVDLAIANEAQLIIAVRSSTNPLVANVYLDGKLYGKTNNQGILSVPGLQTNQTYLLRVNKPGYEMFAREINLTRAGIETIDANLTKTKVEISSAQLNNLKKERSRRQKNLSAENRPRTKSTQEEFCTVNILLNNTEPITDAFIHINGQLWQGNNYQAPAELQLPAGTYVIEIQKDGYISAPPSYTLDLLNGDYKTISFILTAF